MAAYLIANIRVHDHAVFAEYGRQVFPMVERHGGRYLVRGGAVSDAEGTPNLARVVILEFDDMAKLRAFYDSAEYAPLITLRQSAADGDVALVEGLAA